MTGSPLPSRAPEGLLFRLRALLAEGAAHRLDTAPPYSIVNAPVLLAGEAGHPLSARCSGPKGGGHGHGTETAFSHRRWHSASCDAGRCRDPDPPGHTSRRADPRTNST